MLREMQNEVRAKKHRLPIAAYRGQKAVSFTASIQNRRRAFLVPGLTRSHIDILHTTCSAQSCQLLIYCFMPDHLHVVMRGENDQSNCKTAMDVFKYESGLWFSRFEPWVEWQHDYHDHIIRSSEDLRGHLRYIAANPVRAGIVEGVLDYPFSGSSVGELGELLLDLEFDEKFGKR
jgi:putative transposase